jgi:1,4-alpha-glucan branching enzyme
VRRLSADLNRLYRDMPALHELDFDGAGFAWVDCHDSGQSVLVWIRRARDGGCLVVAMNFTPHPRHGYRIGMPAAGVWSEVLNSDSAHYGGADIGNVGAVDSVAAPWMGLPASAAVTLPPLAAIVLRAA